VTLPPVPFGPALWRSLRLRRIRPFEKLNRSRTRRPRPHALLTFSPLRLSLPLPWGLASQLPPLTRLDSSEDHRSRHSRSRDSHEGRHPNPAPQSLTEQRARLQFLQSPKTKEAPYRPLWGSTPRRDQTRRSEVRQTLETRRTPPFRKTVV
jgi:hypothetical protein